MYDNLKSLGITQPEDVDRYSLRQEANNDILKIYFRKDKGEFFAKSVKFKYPRQRKTVVLIMQAMAIKKSMKSTLISAMSLMSWISFVSVIRLKLI